MHSRTGTGGFTLVELIVVIAILVVLVSILLPHPYGNGEKARQIQCTSNLKQLALAMQIYAQDKGSQYPGIDGSGWVKKIAPYVGNSTDMFVCPCDKSGDNMVSYAISGLLIREDGSGVLEKQIISPSEVGAICDASPSLAYHGSRLIGGGAGKKRGDIAAEPEPRHGKGVVVGFVDGHAKYFQGGIDKFNEGNGAMRAMYHALPLGLIDNPTACMGPGAEIAGKGKVFVGGEYAARPFLLAAAAMYAGGYDSKGFQGQGYAKRRPEAGWAWSAVSGAGGPVSPAIAYDALVFIVSKSSKIPTLPSFKNGTYLTDIATIRTLFQTGYQQNTVQVYHMSTVYSATDIYARKILGVAGYGKGALQVADDAEIVKKVTNDPYGIGYCSSAIADPDRVTILSFKGLGTDGGDAIWPRGSKKFRWVMPASKDSTWPWKRSINVMTGKKPGAAEVAVTGALRGGELYKNLVDGPLFTWGYWPGDY